MVQAQAIADHRRRLCSCGMLRLKMPLQAPTTIIQSASLMF